MKFLTPTLVPVLLICCAAFIKSGGSCITLLHTQDSCVLVTSLGRKASNPLNDYNKSLRRKFLVSYLRVLYVYFVSVDGAASIYKFIHSLIQHQQ